MSTSPIGPAPRPSPAPRPLLLTDDPLVLDDLLRLAELAGVEVDVAPSVRAAGLRFLAAPTVIVGPDVAVGIGPDGLVPRRPGLVLVGVDMDDLDVWDRAGVLGAEHVVFLPDAQGWLVDLLAGAAHPRAPARVVGVVGGRGGAGATTLAVALALGATRHGDRGHGGHRVRPVVLVDADPLGGGIDLALGAEDVEGPRFGELGRAGLPPSAELWSDLPSPVGGLSVLSFDRVAGPSLPLAELGELLDLAARRATFVVVDLPRALVADAAAILRRCDTVLVVVPAEVRACAAAARVAEVVQAACSDVRVVVRGPAPGGLDADLVAQALDLPLAGTLRPEPALDRDLDHGAAPGRRPGSPLGRLASRLARELSADVSLLRSV